MKDFTYITHEKFHITLSFNMDLETTLKEVSDQILIYDKGYHLNI